MAAQFANAQIHLFFSLRSECCWDQNQQIRELLSAVLPEGGFSLWWDEGLHLKKWEKWRGKHP